MSNTFQDTVYNVSECTDRLTDKQTHVQPENILLLATTLALQRHEQFALNLGNEERKPNKLVQQTTRLL